ncbi:MAG: S9 family peptidase [Planctomycetes bacterium]|nr:S9 family peptidase [Planctomycetota bacterium]
MPPASVPLIPRLKIFGNPERTMPQLSPDGTRLIYLAPRDGVMNIWIRTVGKADDRPLTDERRRGVLVGFWSWTGDRVLTIRDRDGDENWHVHAIDPGGGAESVDLTPFPGARAEFVAMPPEMPAQLLVGINNRDPRLHDVHRLDLRTGKLELAQTNDVGARAWVADSKLRLRVAIVPTKDGQTILHRRDADAPWSELLRSGHEDPGTHPLSFAADDRTLWLASSIGTNAVELRTLDTETGAQKTVASDAAADLADRLFHPTRHTPQAVSFERERISWTVLDPSVAADFDAVAKLAPGDFHVASRDLEDRTWIVAFEQDRAPVHFRTWDRTTRKSEFLFSTRPELAGLPLAEMQPVSWRARDGLVIPGYLSLPPGADPARLPAVVLVHGGPWVRDSWRFHPEVQWLANRGYAVLQVNYRGSSGYGKAFLNAGDREWGGRMQDDVSDGVKWLIERGVADARRVAIYGGSYGGYAALSGMTTTPELYACGIANCGPSNLLTFLKTIPPYWDLARSFFRKRVGDPDNEPEFLKSRSPLFRVDRIRAPLLVGQGANDPRVVRAESLQMVDALRAAGKEVEYIEFADEGHGFLRPENRLKFYAAAERFLARHLGGRCEE